MKTEATTLPDSRAVLRAWRLVQRNLLVYRHTWMVLFSGFFEPIFYLLAVGYGIGSLVGEVQVIGGRAVPYAAFVAPAMLATSALNGAITEGYFNPYFKLHYQGTYDAILAAPMRISDIAWGEVAWAQIRGTLYSAGFLVIMLLLGLVLSPWAILALPAAMFVSASFSAGALMLMTFSSKVEDFDKVMNLLVHPMFLFSTTFFPLTVYPEALRALVALTPLYHGVSLLRGLTTGTVHPSLLVHVGYLALFGWFSMRVATHRLHRALEK